MSSVGSRSSIVVASAVVIAGILISASLLIATEGTKTSTFTMAQVTTSTLISTTTITASPSSTGPQLDSVTFQQVRYCNTYNMLPWTVTIDGLTQVQPSNQSLPLPSNTFSTRASNQNLTRMTFYLTPGSYPYTLNGGAQMGGGFYPTSGTVNVNGPNIIVNVTIWLSITC